ncbi:MAG: hypothetical protein KDI33_09420 [Halioglobus sp.]|nr:hypothetical protein [Halioglobus sp.]
MSSYLLLKYAHLIAFVYWLGGDLGTFIASRQVVNDKLSAQSRQVALKIMLACDMGPKLAMPAILPLGIHMASVSGALPISTELVAAAWLVGAYWFTVVLVLFLNEGKPFTQKLSQVDLYFRIAVVLVLLGWVTVLAVSGQGALWAQAKVAIFALMVCCGIAIRINLKPFVPAFIQIMSGGDEASADNASANATMARCIARCRPFVWLIWAGLFTSAALGIHLLG